jgi:hypothetical protein
MPVFKVLASLRDLRRTALGILGQGSATLIDLYEGT